MGQPTSTATMDWSAWQQAKIAKEQFEWWKKLYAPEEKKMMLQLGKPLEQQAYMRRMMGDIEKSYGDIASSTARTLGGRYQYGAGIEGKTQESLKLSKAAARAGAWGAGEQQRTANLMSMFGLGRGSAALATQGMASATAGFGQSANLRAQQEAQKMGQISSSFGGVCCFIFYEGHGSLREDIKKARDEMFNEDSRVSYGYRVMANVLVPLMRKYGWVKKIVQKVMLDPIAEAIKRSNAKQRVFPYNIIGWLWVLIWYLTSFVPGAPMTWEQYHQEVRG